MVWLFLREDTGEPSRTPRGAGQGAPLVGRGAAGPPMGSPPVPTRPQLPAGSVSPVLTSDDTCGCRSHLSFAFTANARRSRHFE